MIATMLPLRSACSKSWHRHLPSIRRSSHFPLINHRVHPVNATRSLANCRTFSSTLCRLQGNPPPHLAPEIPKSEPAVAASSEPETHITELEVPEPRLAMTFTCTVEACHTRSTHQFTRRSYERGIVIVQCPGCKNRCVAMCFVSCREIAERS